MESIRSPVWLNFGCVNYPNLCSLLSFTTNLWLCSVRFHFFLLLFVKSFADWLIDWLTAGESQDEYYLVTRIKELIEKVPDVAKPTFNVCSFDSIFLAKFIHWFVVWWFDSIWWHFYINYAWILQLIWWVRVIFRSYLDLVWSARELKHLNRLLIVRWLIALLI